MPVSTLNLDLMTFQSQVVGLSEKEVKGVEDVLELIKLGTGIR